MPCCRCVEDVHVVLWACLLCMSCTFGGYGRSWDLGRQLSNLAALAFTGFELCISN